MIAACDNDLGLIASRSRFTGMPRVPVPGDLDPAAEPDVLVAQGVADEPLDACELAGPAAEAAVQAYRHHLRPFLALGVEHVEGVLEVAEELLAGGPAAACEAHVVRLQRIG